MENSFHYVYLACCDHNVNLYETEKSWAVVKTVLPVVTCHFHFSDSLFYHEVYVCLISSAVHI